MAISPEVSRGRSRWGLRWLCVLGLAAVCAAASSQTLQGSLIAGGGKSVSPGGCFALEGASGEALAGSTSGGVFAIQSGFWAGVGSQRRDALFRGNFQECST